MSSLIFGQGGSGSGGGGGGNNSVGLTDATAPGYATEIGSIDADGNLQGASASNPIPVSGSFTPGANGTLISGQKAVTGSAAAISTTVSCKTLTIHALSTNAISVFVGSSGVSTSTGYELAPGDSVTIPINNLDLVYTIASTTGASVQWLGTN